MVVVVPTPPPFDPMPVFELEDDGGVEELFVVDEEDEVGAAKKNHKIRMPQTCLLR